MKILNFNIGIEFPIFLIAGPCVVESESLAIDTAGYLKEVTSKIGMNFVYKTSIDKANRSSIESFRGLGTEKGLNILETVKNKIGVPILTDVHDYISLNEIASVVNILQIPAFLCRQTNFILSVCSQNLPVNIKKGQFLAPWDINNVLKKAKSTGNKKIMICERGTSFGYNNLVSDMRSLATMRKNHVPIIYDATHSVQLPGNKGKVSDGNAELIPTLARSAVAAGISGIFLETHPKPKYALSDGPNSLPIGKIEGLLKKLKKIDEVIKLSNIRPIL